MIRCRTKKLAIEGAKKINETGIYCEYNGLYGIYAFKTSEDENKGYNILKKKKEQLKDEDIIF